MYKVLVDFTDVFTHHVYKKGDAFPAENQPEPTQERLLSLLSGVNKRGIPLIVETVTTKAPVTPPEPPEQESMTPVEDTAEPVTVLIAESTEETVETPPKPKAKAKSKE